MLHAVPELVTAAVFVPLFGVNVTSLEPDITLQVGVPFPLLAVNVMLYVKCVATLDCEVIPLPKYQRSWLELPWLGLPEIVGMVKSSLPPPPFQKIPARVQST